MGVSVKEPLSTDFQKVIEAMGPLDPERQKNAEACRGFIERYHHFDVPGFLDMMTPDGVLETPYRRNPDGSSVTEVRGNQDILRDHEVVMRLYGNHDCLWMKMWATSNPSLFVYKSKSWNEVMYGPTKGHIYSNDYVCFVEVSADKVSRFTEYFNPLVESAAFDNDRATWEKALEEAAAAYAAESA